MSKTIYNRPDSISDSFWDKLTNIRSIMGSIMKSLKGSVLKHKLFTWCVTRWTALCDAIDAYIKNDKDIDNVAIS